VCSSDLVYKILSNPLYKGNRRWNDEILLQPELRIIDDSTFASVANRLKNNLNNSVINKHNRYDYLLTNKIKCGCGNHFVGQGRHNLYMCKSKKYAAGCNIKSIKIDWLDSEIRKHLMTNYNGLMRDFTGLENKNKELQDEINILEAKINDEKKTQNYLINNITKIGQMNFDKKFDQSTILVQELQNQIDEMNIKISNARIYVDTTRSLAAINSIDDDEIQKLFNYEGSGYTQIVEKETIRKVIEEINVDNDIIQVILVNGISFVINRKSTM
jgi:hypothetical protein